VEERSDAPESVVEPYFGVTRLFRRRYPVDEGVEA